MEQKHYYLRYNPVQNVPEQNLVSYGSHLYSELDFFWNLFRHEGAIVLDFLSEYMWNPIKYLQIYDIVIRNILSFCMLMESDLPNVI